MVIKMVMRIMTNDIAAPIPLLQIYFANNDHDK